MTLLNRIRRALLALLLTGTAAGAQAAGPLAAGSLYASGAALTDQSGRVFHLADLRGEPVLVSMFYSSCSMVCPMIFETIRATLDKGGKSARDGVRVLMITVDPERDSVAVLKKTAADHGADDRWQLARADSSGTRSIAALLASSTGAWRTATSITPVRSSCSMRKAASTPAPIPSARPTRSWSRRCANCWVPSAEPTYCPIRAVLPKARRRICRRLQRHKLCVSNIRMRAYRIHDAVDSRGSSSSIEIGNSDLFCTGLN